MKPQIKNVLRFVGKFAKGAVKSVPFAGALIDGIEMAMKKEVVTGEPKSHDKIVWVAEVIGLIAVVGYLVHKNILTVDVLTDLINTVLKAL